MQHFNLWFRLPLLCFFWLTLDLFIPLPAHAQDQLVSIQHYSVKQGLSNQYIQHSIQSRQGIIWIATRFGLNRFDGNEVQQYTLEKNGLRSNDCKQIVEDRNGLLWLVGTGAPPIPEQVVDIFDPITEKVTPLEALLQPPFSGEDIAALQSDLAGALFILLQNGQVYRYDGMAFHLLLHYEAGGALQLAVSDMGQAALLDQNKSLLFDSLGKILYQAPLPEAADFIRVGKDRFWVGKRRPGDGPSLWEFQPGQAPEPIYFRNSEGAPVKYNLERSFKAPVYPDAEGRWWVYSSNRRLLLLGPDGKFLCDISSHVENTWLPLPIYINFDRRHVAWAGTHNGLFSIFVEKNPFTAYLKPESTADTRSIIEDTEGNLYILQNGEAWMKGASGSFTGLGLPAWLGATRDREGNLWFGDYSYKVHRYDPVSGKKTTFSAPGKDSQVLSRGVFALHADSLSGRIWVGTEVDGLAFVDTIKKCILPYTDYNDFQHLWHATVNCFLQDGRRIWMGTRQGMYLLDPQKGVVAEYSRRTGHLPHDDILHIHKDEEGLFWLASRGGGLIRWDRETGTYRQFTQWDGLSHNIVYAAYEDEFGRLWLPSNRGLMYFDKQSFDVHIYLPRDGLPHEEFNYTSHHQAQDGRLYFGGLKGVIAFYPSELSDKGSELALSPSISQYFELDGATGAFVDKTSTLLREREIRLKPKNRSFLLKLAFPDYQSPKDNLFAYRIEGLHNDWIYQQDNTIRVNGLPYNSFVLHLKAQGANGRWSSQELSLPLIMMRPFYLRPWFLLACIVLAIALAWWRMRSFRRMARQLEAEVKKRTLRIEQDKQIIEKQAAELRRLDEVKSHFFANMAHELRTPITLILSPLKKILQEADLDNRTFTSLRACLEANL